MDTIDHKTAFKNDANRKKSKSGFQKKVGLIFVTLGVIIVINFYMYNMLCPPPEQEEKGCRWITVAVIAMVDIVFAGAFVIIKLIYLCLN